MIFTIQDREGQFKSLHEAISKCVEIMKKEMPILIVLGDGTPCFRVEIDNLKATDLTGSKDEERITGEHGATE